MALTSPQLTALKNDIIADGTLNALPNNADGAFAIADAYNQLASPAFYVWLTSAPVGQLLLGNFDWTRVDNLTVGKSRIFEWMSQQPIVDMSSPSVRAGINACFAVAVADAPCRLAMFQGGSRQARRCEKLFSTGTGTIATDTGTGPATMTREGTINYLDVMAARAS